MKERLIGLNNIVGEIEVLARRTQAFQNSSINPGHLICALDHGNGRTSVVRFLADSLSEADPLRFSYCGAQQYLEFTLDDSVQETNNIFNQINANCGYANEYRGVLSFSVDSLSSYLDEAQTALFLKKLKTAAKAATVICFVPCKKGSKNNERLVRKIQETLVSAPYLIADAYTSDQLCAIGLQMIEQEFFLDCSDKKMINSLFSGCRDIPEVKTAIVRLAECADLIGNQMPVITPKSIQSVMGGMSYAK